ncbi:hypothetical protein GGI25_006135 [Coemansia spiralis]|uniref:Uncharacterized protein n=2 Tax=Coemansia TaxID=4863 RepID=A0A9W8G1A5_9FUNG|nr:hypothetical protein BX070DRAFT_235972 [Coemansia spiralis]KAJ1986892.1 hypothetical protein EDC05_006101 [Coemansia umbellata]KAJ2618945.1 hypothetical protein GGI26_006230 [Coemansia sp. RSA 1358]KAJ2669488.1 hypothetical protein GGI25_006135 [Coemansia spiralis]
MSARVPTAFRPLETASFDYEPMAVRRAATALPSHKSDPHAQERLLLLSRLEQRWCASQGPTGCLRSDCAAPVPRRMYSSSSSSSLGSRQSPELHMMESDACMELRGIFGYSSDQLPLTGMRSPSSASSSFSASDDCGFFPLEEIVVRADSPISRSGNPMPLDAGFGATF